MIFLAEPRRLFRYLLRLGDHVRRPLAAAEARGMLERQLAARRRSFLDVLKRGIFDDPGSPYLALLDRADISFQDVTTMVGSEGVESTLEHLYDSGVHVTMDEFKGRRPIARPGLELPVDPKAFDNPLLTGYYRARTGGSRGPGMSVPIDFDLLRHEGAYMHLYMSAFGLKDRPVALWLTLPPSAPAVRNLLRYAGVAKRVERWFSQDAATWSGDGWKFALFTIFSRYATRVAGGAFPKPRHVPTEQAIEVASWLGDQCSKGLPAVLDTNASSAVHVSQAAREHGIDIRGSHFRIGAEPLTDGKLRAIDGAGCTAATHYAMAEIGAIGFACADAPTIDDVHLLTDKVAAIERPRALGADGGHVPALLFTTLLPSSPKLMLNVESGDYARRETRPCGCPFGRLGYRDHLSRIRSYEKLTSQGVTFLDTELVRLVEEVLPARFGGEPTDYQIVEGEVDGLTTVSVVVSPIVGEVDESEVLEATLAELEAYPGGDIMVAQWRAGRVLRVVRREPYQTASAKVLPLHLAGDG